MNTKTRQLNISNIEKKVFWGVLTLLILLVISYTYFVNQTILNIVQRETLEEEIVVLNSELSEIEFDYIALKNKITIDYAYSIGFNDVDNVKFASRKLAGQNISLRGN